jgi:hypothetical protein
MNVAKTIQSIRPSIKGSGDLEDKLRAIVKEFANNDSDIDVKYFGQRALSSFA